jgi:membrane-associated phospholipid phosphatase
MSSRARAALLGLSVTLLIALTVTIEANHLAPLTFDRAVQTWALEHRSRALTGVAVAITDTGVGVVAYALAVAAGLLIARTRGWEPTWAGPVAAVIGLAGVQLIRNGLVQGIARPRPAMADWATTASGPSFPSGHTTTSGTVAALLCLGLGRASQRALAVAWAVTVGMTRVYLGVHWPTDVLGGWLLVIALALTAATVLSVSTGSTPEADQP